MQEVYLDTNIWLRYLIKEKGLEEQHKVAASIFTEIEAGELKAWVSILVIGELVWALEKFYHAKREVMIPRVLKLLNLKGMVVLEREKWQMIKVLNLYSQVKYDFTDVYLSVIAGQTEIKSFDKDVKRLARVNGKI